MHYQARQSLGRSTVSEPAQFRISLTADFFDAAGLPKFADMGLSVFENHPHVNVTNFSEHQPEIAPDQLANCHGVIVLTPALTRQSLANCNDLLAVGRFGVGYDSVDVDACTEANVLAMITAGAVDRPVAEATVGWMLALTHRVLAKDLLVREGNWDDRSQFMGCELRDRTLGVIGLGGIGRQLVALLKSFGMQQPIAFDPCLPPEVFNEHDVRSVELDELLATADRYKVVGWPALLFAAPSGEVFWELSLIGEIVKPERLLEHIGKAEERLRIPHLHKTISGDQL